MERLTSFRVGFVYTTPNPFLFDTIHQGYFMLHMKPI